MERSRSFVAEVVRLWPSNSSGPTGRRYVSPGHRPGKSIDTNFKSPEGAALTTIHGHVALEVVSKGGQTLWRASQSAGISDIRRGSDPLLNPPVGPPLRGSLPFDRFPLPGALPQADIRSPRWATLCSILRL